MRFQLLDTIIDQAPDRIVAIKNVSLAEEYLGDHFPTFPVLPGVMMLETMVQAARAMLATQADGPLVLGEARSVKYAAMVRPGEALRVEVVLKKRLEDGSFDCKGTGVVVRNAAQGNSGDAPDNSSDGASGNTSGDGETAVTGRFTMRPVRI